MSKTSSKEKKQVYWKSQEPPKSDEVFTDPLFPPTINSLIGLDSSGNIIDKETYNEKIKEIKKDKISFFRPKEILGDDYCLFSEKIEIDDVKQGEIGDCYFISSIANLCKFPNKIRKMFKQTTKNENGFYEIEFCIDGKNQIVIIDDYLPAFKDSKKACYAQPIKKQIWVMLLEKAWAKVNRGYIYIISGYNSEALEFLTGRGSFKYKLKNKEGEELKNYQRKILKKIQLADKNNTSISCSIIKNENDKDIEDIKKLGLVPNHAYSILDFLKIETLQGEKVYLFKLRNPWASKEWIGDWSDESTLWDSKTKSQVKFEEKDDGIFFINDIDFFKYFNDVEICYLFLDSEEAIYEIDEENIQNAGVFIIETEEEGFLSVSVPRENCRIHPNLTKKILPTYLSLNKYNPNAKNKFKTFIDYDSVSVPDNNCTLNLRINKGNYLIYVYRDFDHAECSFEKNVTVKITCSAKFKHAQMAYDERNKGFPLLQNIILQAAFKQHNYDPDSGKEFDAYDNGIKGIDIGYLIRYYATPGYFLQIKGGKERLEHYFFLSPYLDSNTQSYNRVIPAGKYLIILGMWDGVYGSVSFSCRNSDKTDTGDFIPEFDNNEIDLTLYTDFNYNMKSPKFKEKKIETLEKRQKEFYTDGTDGKIHYKSLSELQIEYGDYIKLLDDITIDESYNKYQWGIIKTEYLIFIGQFDGNEKRGKGLYINPNNIFLGEFRPWQIGKGYTYDKNFQKLYYYIYKGAFPQGDPVYVEKELEQIEQEKKKKEEELKKEQERLKKIKEEKEALLKKREKELVIYFLKENEERKKKEQALLALKKAEEEALAEKKKIEEEKQKEYSPRGMLFVLRKTGFNG